MVKWCLLGVHQIHRYLCLAVDLQPQSLHVSESARRAAHCFGDVLGDLKIRCGSEINVVGDEERTRTDGGRAAGRVDLIRTEVRFARWILAELVAQSLELSPANVSQILSRRRCRCAFV